MTGFWQVWLLNSMPAQQQRNGNSLYWMDACSGCPNTSGRWWIPAIPMEKQCEPSLPAWAQPENAMAALLCRIRRVILECITAALAKKERA